MWSLQDGHQGLVIEYQLTCYSNPRFQVLISRLLSSQLQACRYLVINSGTSKSPEFTRQRDRYACGALAALRPFIFKSPTGLKNNTTTMANSMDPATFNKAS